MPKITETGFTDYVSTLINETIDAISVAHLEQEQKILDLKSDLIISDNDLIEKYNLKEAISFDENDTDEEKEELLKNAVKNHRALLENYFEKGFIKTFVDKGKLSTKFIFSFKENNTIEIEKSVKSTPEKPLKKITKKPVKEISKTFNEIPNQMRLIKDIKKMNVVNLSLKDTILKSNNINIKPNQIINTKLSVIPISKANSDSDSSTTNITSYLELEFRTVIDG